MLLSYVELQMIEQKENGNCSIFLIQFNFDLILCTSNLNQNNKIILFSIVLKFLQKSKRPRITKTVKQHGFFLGACFIIQG